jgi:hypothetical protein
VLILYKVLVGLPAFDAVVGRYVLMSQVTNGVRPPLPESMAATVADIIRQGWSADPVARDPSTTFLTPCGGLNSS